MIDNNEEIQKANIFFSRTITPNKVIESVESSTDALAVSLYEKGEVDIGFMSKLADKSNDEILEDLQGIIFKNPDGDLIDEFDKYVGWETVDEYLSGNVVDKLKFAKEMSITNDIYKANVEALENVQPIPLTASDISVKIGASWIDSKYYKDFLKEKFNERNDFDVTYSDQLNLWKIYKPNVGRNSLEVSQQYGTKRMNGYELMESLLNQKSPKITDRVEDMEGKVKYVLNKKETIAIKEKAQLFQQEFKEWIFKSPDRAEHLIDKYNYMFNSERNRQFDGSFLRFDGINPSISLRQHQKDAIARTLLGGNTLLDHVVGAGKTYTMIGAGMQMKRMNLSKKPCFVVPNHLVGQWGNEFKELYPKANILVATERDFEKSNRQRFFGRIATGDWDAVIMGHSSFGLIPMSKEYEEKQLRSELNSAKNALEVAQLDKYGKVMVKQLESSIKKLEKKIKILNDMHKDNLITFEKLGIDSIFVDEAHMFKNKSIFTKMGNISGINTTGSKKSQDLEMKCDYINTINKGERNVIFATGTPISNSMVEMFTMQSYLQKLELEKKGLKYFDNWASTYGEVVSAIELNPTGSGFRMKERISKFNNLPELMNMYGKFADVQTSEMLNLPIPKLENNKPFVVAVEPSESQKALVSLLAELSDKVSNGSIPPEIYNMLTVTNDGRLGALDMRAVNVEKLEVLAGSQGIPIKLSQEDFPNSKVNACVDNLFNIYNDTAEDKLTQMVFSDISTPKKGATFSVYNDIREKLILKGVKPEEIAFIHDANTNAEKQAMFRKVREGNIRIILGSTQKMGAGTNVQDRLYALHNLDCPWRPSDLEQRGGRMLRQGNLNDSVMMFNYVTKGSFDSYLWQIIENMQKYISQAKSGKMSTRSVEDIDGAVLNFAEVKAIATGNPLIVKRVELQLEYQRLSTLENQYFGEKYSLENKITKDYPLQIKITENLIEKFTKDVQLYQNNVKPDFEMTIGKKTFDDKKEAGTLLLSAVQSQKYIDKVIGEYDGFKIIPQARESLMDAPSLVLKGETRYVVEISDSDIGTIQRMNNVLKGIEVKVREQEVRLDNLHNQLNTAKELVQESFKYKGELESVKSELDDVEEKLDIGKVDNGDIIDDLEVVESKEYIEEIDELELT